MRYLSPVMDVLSIDSICRPTVRADVSRLNYAERCVG
jgi:hypothetical protein